MGCRHIDIIETSIRRHVSAWKRFCAPRGASCFIQKLTSEKVSKNGSGRVAVLKSEFIHSLNLKAPITTAADDSLEYLSFFFFFFLFQRNKI